jgi:ADP-heptose:LPS heptosyltransferase
MQTLSELRQGKFDLVLDLQGLLRTAVMSLATRAPVRVGLQTAREGARFACHVIVPDTSREVPAHLRCFRVADALGMEHMKSEARIAVTADDQAFAQRAPNGGDIGGSTRWITKRWLPNASRSRLQGNARYGFSTILLGSADDAPCAARSNRLCAGSFRTAGC